MAHRKKTIPKPPKAIRPILKRHAQIQQALSACSSKETQRYLEHALAFSSGR